MTLATITLGSHFFVITGADYRMRQATREFSLSLKLAARTFTNKRGQVVKSGEDKYFAFATDGRGEVRYHINHLEAFKKVLYNHRLDAPGLIEWKTLPGYEAAKIELPIQEHFIPTDLQAGAIEYILDPDRPHSKAVIIQAGGGKTLTAMMAASQQGERMAIFVEPEFMDQWVKAFKENCIIEDKRIVTINGGKQLKSLLWMAQDGELPYYAIIVSTTTFREYIKAYKRTGDAKRLDDEEGFCVPPQNFFEHLGVGLRVIDEAHRSFHQMFVLDLFTHIPNTVALSATLFSGDPFVTKQMEAVYPRHLRYDKGGFNKYVNAFSLHYSLREPSKIRCMGSMGYSHTEFEKSILKSRELTGAYFRMVRENMRYTYDQNYQAGDRCLVYFATIDMCTRFTAYIQDEYPHLSVKRFVEDDPFENLMSADISVSTVRSAGTGKDIAQLTTVIMTPAINSSPTNIQGFGRLRDLNRRNPELGRKMYFVYFVCDDIVKHGEYHDNKVELLRTRALTYEPRFFGTLL